MPTQAMAADTATSSGSTRPVTASPSTTNASVPGISPSERRHRVGHHSHRGCAGGVVDHRERHRRDQSQRQDDRPAALPESRVHRLDGGMFDQPVELPADRAHQPQCDQRAQRAGQHRQGDTQCGAEQQPGGQRERGARKRQHRHHHVRGQERQREPRTDRGRPVAQLQRRRQRNEDRPLRPRSQRRAASRRCVAARPAVAADDHPKPQSAQRVAGFGDDHAYLPYGVCAGRHHLA